MEIKHDQINTLLREGDIEAVNAALADGGIPSFSDNDFRSVDLTGLNTEDLDFSNSRFRLADLSGLDLSSCNLRGASLRGAKVSGVLFPADLPAREIMMSLEYGTRLRY
jgi:uncharacterized protein YjbI with pentapeptide repeats